MYQLFQLQDIPHQVAITMDCSEEISLVADFLPTETAHSDGTPELEGGDCWL